MRKIKIIMLDTDNIKDVKKFKELWNKMRVETEEVFVPRNIKFIGKTPTEKK